MAPSISARGAVAALEEHDPRSPLLAQGAQGAAPGPSATADSQETANPSPASTDRDDDEHLKWSAHMPWWKRPNAVWLYPFVFVLALVGGAVMGPRYELYTQLVCEDLLHIETMTTASSPSPRILNFFPTPHERPPLSTACRTSPLVQGASASLQLQITLVTGILSVITTGAWGGISDRRGRAFVLRLAVFGLTLNDAVLLYVGLFPKETLPFGTKTLLIGAVLEGVLGGIATLMAAHQAYVADTTPSGTRARAFSLFSGIFFAGLFFGPGLGGWLAKHSKTLLGPFYFAFGAHVVYLLFTLLLLPESVSPTRKRKAQDERQAQKAKWAENSQADKRRGRRSWGIRTWTSRLLVPLQPLALLLPRARPSFDLDDASAAASNGEAGGRPRSMVHPEASASHISVSHISRRRELDWNLTLLSIGYFVETCCMGILTPKVSYAQLMFNWGVQELGLFISFASLTRVLALTVVVPLVIKLVHEKPSNISLPQDRGFEGSGFDADLDHEGRLRMPTSSASASASASRYGATDASAQPLNGEPTLTTLEESMDDLSTDVSGHPNEQLWQMRAKHLRMIHDCAFDRVLAMTSILIDAGGYLLLVVGHGHGPIPYVIATLIVSFGGAAPAAMSSLAIALLPNAEDSGKLFAAWSICSAIGSTIVGPIAFIELYEHTAATAPHAIFMLGIGLFVLSSLLVSLVRVRQAKTLPALPPRPHTRASRAAAVAAASSINGGSTSAPSTLRSKPSYGTLSAGAAAAGTAGEDEGPMSSTRSRWRLRPVNPFKGANGSGNGTDNGGGKGAQEPQPPASGA